jgi:hypothetical protein
MSNEKRKDTEDYHEQTIKRRAVIGGGIHF